MVENVARFAGVQADPGPAGGVVAQNSRVAGRTALTLAGSVIGLVAWVSKKATTTGPHVGTDSDPVAGHAALSGWASARLCARVRPAI